MNKKQTIIVIIIFILVLVWSNYNTARKQEAGQIEQYGVKQLNEVEQIIFAQEQEKKDIDADLAIKKAQVSLLEMSSNNLSGSILANESKATRIRSALYLLDEALSGTIQ